MSDLLETVSYLGWGGEVLRQTGNVPQSPTVGHVREFRQAFELPSSETPRAGAKDERMLEWDMLAEELKEFWVAAAGTSFHRSGDGQPDLVEMADALGDIVYLAYGAAARFGIPLDRVIAEIHRSNMTKLNAEGDVIRRHDGKVLKSELYEPPQLRPILGLPELPPAAG